MGLKKYEIITDSGLKRIKALRSFQVQDRYVNIGDAGGVVYDEKTLDQNGNAWIFKGRFNYPGARISGDAVVDVGEATTNQPQPNVTIDGMSRIVSASPLYFLTQSRTANVTLTANDFEQGLFGAYVVGQPLVKVQSPNFIRSKKPIFLGGRSLTVNAAVAGYSVGAVSVDKDGLVIAAATTVTSGEGVTLAIPAGQYAYLRLSKEPVGAITPADATTAALALVTPPYEGNFLIRDSVISLIDTNGNNYNTFIQSGAYDNPDNFNVINSTINIKRSGAYTKGIYLLSNFTNTGVQIDATGSFTDVFGNYDNCGSVYFKGVLMQSKNAMAANSIVAKDCYELDITPENLPGLSGIVLSGNPLTFIRCNMDVTRIYDHPKIKNVYTDIDFTLAETELSEPIGGNVNVILVSSEVNGMYRVYHKVSKLWGPLVECLESVYGLKFLGGDPSGGYNTIIYRDAYFNGEFDIAGTNVFGHKVPHHPREEVLNVAPRAVQGNLDATTVGQTITGVNNVANRVCVPVPLRVNDVEGLKVEGIPANMDAVMLFVTPANVITAVTSSTGDTFQVPTAKLNEYAAYLRFRKSDDTAITPEELAGVTMTVYNGCKIVNTGAAAVALKGNIRVEDNATLINSSITGTGYFGGNCVASSLFIAGSVFMRDNAKFTKTAGTNVIRNLRITENGSVKLGDVTWLGVVQVADNAVLSPTAISLTECDIFMSENASITSSVTIAGVLRMKDNAKVNTGALTTYGDITLCGSYNQTAARSWAGKRVIYSETEPEYDNNVKTQYDF